MCFFSRALFFSVPLDLSLAFHQLPASNAMPRHVLATTIPVLKRWSARTDDDSCRFLNYTVGSSRLKKSHTVAIRNCTRWSKNDCNQPKVCEKHKDSWVDPGYTFSACSVMCCNWDLCNKQGEGSMM